MNSSQVPQILKILHMNFLHEQTITEYMNRLAKQINVFISECYLDHLNSKYSISIFSIHKDQEARIHRNIILLNEMSQRKFKTLNETIPFIKLLTQIHAEPWDTKVKEKFSDLDIQHIYEVLHKHYRLQEQMTDALLEILMHKKALLFDELVKKTTRSESNVPLKYHLNQINEHLKLIRSACSEIYQNSLLPDALASSLLTIIKNLPDMPNHLFQQLKNHIEFSEGINEIEIQAEEILPIINLIRSDTLDDVSLNECFIQLKQSDLVKQIFRHRIKKDTDSLFHYLQQIHSSQPDAFEILNQHILSILCIKMNACIQNQNNHSLPFLISDNTTYYSLLSSMDKKEQLNCYIAIIFGMKFIEHLKYLEKTHFSSSLHKTLMDNDSKLFVTQHHQRLKWYANCLQDAFYKVKDNKNNLSSVKSFLQFQLATEQHKKNVDNNKFEKIFAEHGMTPLKIKSTKTLQKRNDPIDKYINCMDVLNRNALFNELHFEIMEIIINKNPDVILQNLKETIETHINTRFSNFDEYQHKFVSDWQNILKREFNSFKNELALALNLRNQYKQDEEFILANQNQIALIKMHMPYEDESEQVLKRSKNSSAKGLF